MTPLLEIDPALFRALRWRAGRTQAEAGEFMGVGQQAVSSYECGGDALAEWRVLRGTDWFRGIPA